MKLSLVMAAYNAENTLSATLQSILQQNMKPNELIIVNDCSNDSTYKIIEVELNNAPFPVYIINNAVNKGVAASRNIGIQKSNCDLIAFCDADDMLEPCCVEILVELTQLVPTSIVYFGDEQIIKTDGNVRLSSVQSRPGYMQVAKNSTGIDSLGGVVSTLGKDLFMALTGGSFVPMSGVVIRKSALAEVGLFEEELRWSEDLNLFLRLSKFGSFCTTSTRVVIKLEHKNNLTAATRSKPHDERTREDDHKSALVSLNSALAFSYVIDKSRSRSVLFNDIEMEKVRNQVNGNVRACHYFASKCGWEVFWRYKKVCQSIAGSPKVSLKDYVRVLWSTFFYSKNKWVKYQITWVLTRQSNRFITRHIGFSGA